MRTRTGKRPAAAASIAAATLVAAAMLLAPALAAAGPPDEEYLEICSLYGARFHLIPDGDDICVNVAMNDARVKITDSLVWRWRMPTNEYELVKAPKAACKGGKLVKFGDFSGSDLTLNPHERYETITRIPVEPATGRYLASVIYQGGFTGVGEGNFCTFYYLLDPSDPDAKPTYAPLGCIDTAAHADPQVTIAYTPDRPVPGLAAYPISIIGANGDDWDVASTAAIGGSLSIWLCLRGGE